MERAWCRGALGNPVRDVGRIQSTASARALSAVEALDLRAAIRAHPRCQRWGLVDFTDFMLATGMRIGEALAVTFDALDSEAGTAEVRGTVVRVKGAELTIKWRTKNRSGHRTLELPTWTVMMLRHRREQSARTNGASRDGRSGRSLTVRTADRRDPGGHVNPKGHPWCCWQQVASAANLSQPPTAPQRPRHAYSDPVRETSRHQDTRTQQPDSGVRSLPYSSPPGLIPRTTRR